jgi:hypothetical protein
MGSHPTSKARRKRQKLKCEYAKLREHCQLAGIIETTPECAVRNEVAPVAPDPPLPDLVRKAIKDNWATPDSAKAKIIAELLAPFYAEGTDPELLVRLARTLLLADRTQWERDHPEEAGKARGGTVVNNVNAVQVGNVFDDIERDIRIIEGGPAT